MPTCNHQLDRPIERIQHPFRSLLFSFLFIASILVGSTRLASLVEADEQLAYDRDNQDNKVARLVIQLDDSRYVVRESALEKLSNVGAPALRPLALKAITGSPESAWRVKQALESIGTQGDEATFFQAIGILQLLYLDGSQSLSQKTIQLQAQWKLKQKENAVENLRKLGAVISDPLENQPALANAMGNFEQRIFINGIAVNQQAGLVFETNPAGQTSATTASTQSELSPRQTLTPSEATQKVDEILLASLEENREKVFNTVPHAPSNQAAGGTHIVQDQIELQLRIEALRRQNGVSVGFNRGTGISVSLGPNWQGNEENLKQLHYIDGLTKIELNHFRPDANQYAELTKLNSVTTIKIVGDEIPADDLRELSKIGPLQELELAERTIDSPTLKNFSSSPNLAFLMFTDCTIPTGSLSELVEFPSLHSLFFSEMQIDASIFDAIEDLKNLNNINLSVCKFETPAYRKLEQSRPSLRIAFTPQAFLGVRGPTDFNDLGGCEISQVVAGSGAEKGGMQAGDIIEKIDSQRIERFEDLRLHIAQYKAGETLTVAIVRDGKPVELKIELTPYDTTLK